VLSTIQKFTETFFTIIESYRKAHGSIVSYNHTQLEDETLAYHG